MHFDWDEYLNLAKELSKTNSDACYRSSISRAYYAAYCRAASFVREPRHGGFLQTLPPLPPRRTAPWGVHEQVWMKLKKVYKGYSIGDEGLTLKAARTNADYEANTRIDLSKVEIAIQTSERLIAELKSIEQILNPHRTSP